MRAFLVATLSVAVLSTLWALASPLMSVPDEPSHTVKATAVVRGELAGATPDREGVGAQTLDVEVPKWVDATHSLVCYAFEPNVTAACADDVVVDGDEHAPTPTTAGNYNPVYYVYAGLPSLVLADEPAMYAMRIMSGLVAAVFVGGMFSALVQFPRRWWAVAAGVASLTPMVLFLNGAINPNSLEYATTGALFANLVLLVRRREQGMPHAAQVAWVAASGVLLANSKGAALAWLLVAVVVAFTLAGWRSSLQLFRDRASLIGIGVLGAGTVFALWWILSRDALSSGPYPSAGTPWYVGFARMILETFEFGYGVVGLFGWLDAPAPTWVLLAFGAVLCAIPLVAIAIIRGRRLVAVAIALVAVLFVPAVIQSAIVTEQGYVWQGRYNLALLVVLLLAAGMALDESVDAPKAIPLRIARLTVVVLAVAHVAAFVWAIRRYALGQDAGAAVWALVTAPQWQPPLGIVPISVLFAASCAGVVAIIWPRREPIATAVAASSADASRARVS